MFNKDDFALKGKTKFAVFSLYSEILFAYILHKQRRNSEYNFFTTLEGTVFR